MAQRKVKPAPAGASNYKHFRSARHCPNAFRFEYAWVNEGDFVTYSEGGSDPRSPYRIGKVVCLVRRDGTGKEYAEETLLVLTPNDLFTAGFVRHVPLSAVIEVRKASSGGDFARWFFFGEMPKPQTLCEFVQYGAMSDAYLGHYLTTPEGKIRSDWKNRKANAKVRT